MTEITSHQEYASSGGDVPGFPQHGFAITPSDTDTFNPPITVYAGTGGTVRVIPARGGGGTVDVVVPDGGVVPFKCKAVYSSGTTAANLLGSV